jgi:hypothetical protein
MKSFLKTTAAALTLIPLPALAVNYPQDVDQFSHITDMPLNEREILLAAAFMMIAAVGLASRPSRSRVLATRRWLIVSHRLSLRHAWK